MMDAIPKVCDFSTATDFITAFELHMDCFLMTKSFDSKDHDDIRMKFLKFAMSKCPGYNALGVDGRTTYESLKKKVSLLLQPTATPLKDFFDLECANYKSATDYIVESKRLLSCFIGDEPTAELLIRQRLLEQLPSDAGLMIRNMKTDFSEFVKQLSSLWNLVSSHQPCLLTSRNEIQKRRYSNSYRPTSERCYTCSGYGHYARFCPSGSGNDRSRNRQANFMSSTNQKSRFRRETEPKNFTE